MKRIVLALLLSSFGCSHPAVDACKQFPTQTCVSLTVQAASGRLEISQIEIASTTTDLPLSGRTPSTPLSPAAALPVAVPLLIADGFSGDFGLTVRGIANDAVVGEASVQATIAPRQHLKLTATLATPAGEVLDLAMSDDGGDGGPPDDLAGCVPATSCPATVACGMFTDHCGGNSFDCGPCQLTAVHPVIATTGAKVVIEGTFGTSASVSLAGGPAQAATLEGPHRAVFTVPAGARPGDLTVDTGGTTVGKLTFYPEPYALAPAPGDFEPNQANGIAQQVPTIVNQRFGSASFVIGKYVYVAGGANSPDNASVERARINADGSLSSFSVVTGVNLNLNRYGHRALVVGPWVYLFAGENGATATATVERAAIHADDTISTFNTVAGVSLMTARHHPALAVVGNAIYLIGGATVGTTGLTSVERATINPNGDITTFSQLAVPLQTGRVGATAQVAGDSLYVIGGMVNTVERAVIDSDGNLGNFVLQSGVTLTANWNNSASIVLGNTLYNLGGYGTGYSDNIDAATINADGTLSTFTKYAAARLGAPLSDSPLEVINGNLWLLGGSGTPGGSATTVRQAVRTSLNGSGALSSFADSTTIKLSSAREQFSAAVSGSKLYLFGGIHTPGSSANDIDTSTIAADGTLTNFAPSSAVLSASRAGHCTLVLPAGIYLIGGGINAIDFAPINADGSLGPFAASGFTTAAVLSGQSCIVMGANVYLLGGIAGGTVTGAVEQAPIVNGALGGSFTVMSTFALVTPRTGHSAASIGNKYLYVFGGSSQTAALGTVERVALIGDGTFNGIFVNYTASTLAVPRSVHSTLIVGKYIYLMGGNTSTGATAGIERATIASDDTIGPFAVVLGVTLPVARNFPVALQLNEVPYNLGGIFGTLVRDWVSSSQLQ